MIGNINELVDAYESDVVNLCDPNGNCVECGECCSAILPLSAKELKIISGYIEKNSIKPHRHTLCDSQYDMMCPFLDTSKSNHKCEIYEVRPKMCREFKCDSPPGKIKKDKTMMYKSRKQVYMWDFFLPAELRKLYIGI